MLVHPQRIYPLNKNNMGQGPILYWMSREQRVRDNWGLLHARELAGSERSLVVVFCLVPNFLGATLRHYDFMLRGLEAVEADLAALGIPFALRLGDPAVEMMQLVDELGAGAVVTDFDPLRIKQEWQQRVGQSISVPLLEVDGHNVVPARVVSPKQEYAARTIRPKIHALSAEFLDSFPALEPVSVPVDFTRIDWDVVRQSLTVDTSVPPVALESGERAAHAALDVFVKEKLASYAEQRNDPNADATSQLSAYFHFGQLAPQRAALAVAASGRGDGQDVYLEELIVRRELADNFCLHNPHYDQLSGAAPWALKTLKDFAADRREYVYSQEAFETAVTHSRLWNAAQEQLRQTGYMHGYMRMYWAKKILEWSASPAEALEIVIYLNDRYQLDGRDPNGYVGALWSVAGLHDRAWKKRPVYGSIRYMNENGCRRKFDVDAYCERWLGAD